MFTGRPRTWLAASLVSIISLSMAAIYGFGHSEGTVKGTMQAAVSSRPAEGDGAATVHIDNFSFNPAVLTVPAGTRVTWMNRDDAPHTATSTKKLFKSAALDTDETFTYVFEKPGTYDYYCAIHPHMTGQIVVTAATR